MYVTMSWKQSLQFQLINKQAATISVYCILVKSAKCLWGSLWLSSAKCWLSQSCPASFPIQCSSATDLHQERTRQQSRIISDYCNTTTSLTPGLTVAEGPAVLVREGAVEQPPQSAQVLLSCPLLHRNDRPVQLPVHWRILQHPAHTTDTQTNTQTDTTDTHSTKGKMSVAARKQ